MLQGQQWPYYTIQRALNNVRLKKSNGARVTGQLRANEIQWLEMRTKTRKTQVQIPDQSSQWLEDIGLVTISQSNLLHRVFWKDKMWQWRGRNHVSHLEILGGVGIPSHPQRWQPAKHRSKEWCPFTGNCRVENEINNEFSLMCLPTC